MDGEHHMLAIPVSIVVAYAGWHSQRWGTSARLRWPETCRLRLRGSWETAATRMCARKQLSVPPGAQAWELLESASAIQHICLHCCDSFADSFANAKSWNIAGLPCINACSQL